MKALFGAKRATLFLYNKNTSILSGKDETDLIIKCPHGKGITGKKSQPFKVGKGKINK